MPPTARQQACLKQALLSDTKSTHIGFQYQQINLQYLCVLGRKRVVSVNPYLCVYNS